MSSQNERAKEAEELTALFAMNRTWALASANLVSTSSLIIHELHNLVEAS